MVVVSFYPFRKMIKQNLSFGQMIEYIDIGGPSLLRAGAKNFKNVACLSSASQYRRVADELDKNKGSLGEATLRKLAADVFKLTKEYDNCIYSYLRDKEMIGWNLEKIDKLRYGENPHQKASLFKLIGKNNIHYKQYQGKKISFNNILDLNAAYLLIKEFSEPAAAVFKHNSPCGVAIGKNIAKAYAKAYRCDPLSSFGGIISLNRKVDKKTAQEIVKSGFRECIIAPAYSKESLKIFSKKQNLRVMETDFKIKNNAKDVKATVFGYLIQDQDKATISKNSLKVVTKRKPTAREVKDLIFAWKVAKYTKSNAIVVGKNLTTLGIGAGQPSRVGAVKIALNNVSKSTKGAVVASDAFFPKEDAIEAIKKSGAKAIIQPGGSIMDEKLIELCNKYKLSMVFTGVRHFRH
jgi:phosphoribosylaminoimidazolecarboxamide formyltransferase/IMP cyclohydrolase